MVFICALIHMKIDVNIELQASSGGHVSVGYLCKKTVGGVVGQIYSHAWLESSLAAWQSRTRALFLIKDFCSLIAWNIRVFRFQYYPQNIGSKIDSL